MKHSRNPQHIDIDDSGFGYINIAPIFPSRGRHITEAIYLTLSSRRSSRLAKIAKLFEPIVS